MLDREESLRIGSILAKEKLVADVKVGDKEYKKGSVIPKEELENVNRFAMGTIIKGYAKEIQSQYDMLKANFLEQKKNLTTNSLTLLNMHTKF